MTTYQSGMDYTPRRSNGGVPDTKNPRSNFRQQLPQSQPAPAPVLQPNPAHSVCYSSSTVPSHPGKSRTKFVNLRDSVKKSPTKSTAKVSGSVQNFPIREHLLWNSVSFEKVRGGPPARDKLLVGPLGLWF